MKTTQETGKEITYKKREKGKEVSGDYYLPVEDQIGSKIVI